MRKDTGQRLIASSVRSAPESARRPVPFALVQLTFLLLTVPSLVVSGCGDTARFQPPRVPPGEYCRVVSLTPSVTEIFYALGAGERLVGVTTWCDYPPAARGITKVGDFIQPNLEALLALDPDLIVLAPTGDLLKESYDNLEKLGFALLVVWNNTLEETLDAVTEIGRALRLEEAAAALRTQLEEEIRRQQERLASLPAQRVLWLVGRNPLIAVGEGTFQNELLEAARGINVASDLGPWPVISAEFVLRIDPDVIIDSSMDTASSDFEETSPEGNNGSRDIASKHNSASPFARFSTLRALQQGRIHAVHADVLYRPGPRMAEALQLVANTLHPELRSDR